MKRIKKVLALLLAVLLAVGVGAPAAAVSENDTVMTITGPEGPVPYGEAFSLSAAVEVPEEIEIVSVSFRWRVGADWRMLIEGATQSVLHVTSNDSFYPSAPEPFSHARAYFICEIDFTGRDTDGNSIETTYSQSFIVTFEPERMNFFVYLWYLLKEPFVNAFVGVFAYGLISGGFLFLFAPFIFLLVYFVNLAAILQYGFETYL